MPTFTRNAVSIFYEVFGTGIPVLLLAPGGMRSSIKMWSSMPLNPLEMLPTSKFKLIAMDQRNAGRSFGPLGEGWPTYVSDQLALLDHLKIERCLLFGSCIGPSYQMALLKASPKRFPAAVLMQPIGLAEHTTEPEAWEGTNRLHTRSWFHVWSREMLKAGRASNDALQALGEAMFENDRFAFSVGDEEVASIDASLLVMMGIDKYHPSASSRRIVELAARAELVERWRGDASEVAAALVRVQNFLEEHGNGLASSSKL